MNKRAEIGSLMKKLRKQNKLSQATVGNITGYTRQSISMIESDKRTMSVDGLISISKLLKFDFLKLSEELATYKKMEHYMLANELIKLVENNNIKELAKISNENKLIKELNYDEVAMLRDYCEIVVLSHIDNNFIGALNKCFDVLNIKIDEIDNFYPKMGMPNSYYLVTLSMIRSFYKVNDYKNLFSVCTKVVEFLESYYFNEFDLYLTMDRFFVKYYVISLSNLGYCYFINKDYENALIYCNKGIKKSNELNVINELPMLLDIKLKTLYNMGDVMGAKKYYNYFKTICDITESDTYFDSANTKYEKEYTNIFSN